MSATYNRSELKIRADKYCSSYGVIITQQLGFGTQGIVYKTNINTAVKVYGLEDGYKRERDVYKRLKERNIDLVRGLKIPRIRSWNDSLCVFEMSVVHVPCIIDFGGAYLDDPPEHMVRDEIWHQAKAEEFGDNWEEAKAVIREIEYRADLWLSDVNTGNIKFPEKY